MNPYRLVIFDMAGTTVTDQHEVEHCFAQAAAETGLTATAARILAVQGQAKHYVFEMLWREQLGPADPSHPVRVDRSYRRFTEILEAHYLTHEVTPTAGCLDAFTYLREQEILIALTTGFYRKVTDIILEKLGWLQGLDHRYVGTKQSIIQASISSDEVPQGRPEPFLIRKAMHLLNITQPLSVVNVGDTPSDLLSGRAAGVGLNLGVTNGTHTHEQLVTYPHDALLGSLAELAGVLN